MTGSWRCSLDAKGRVAVPSKLRVELGERFYVTKGFESSLQVLSEDAWDALAEQIKTFPMKRQRTLNRMVFGSAATCEPDAQGRILIPQKLRDYANLGKDVTFVGVGDSVEIWDTDTWEELDASMTAEDLAAAMDGE